MKNLNLASDEDIYHMRGMAVAMLNGYSENKTFQNMKKELDVEFIKRGLDKQVIPLSWDLRR